MVFDTDSFIDRRRLKRRLRNWRIAAIFLAVLVVVAAVGRFYGPGALGGLDGPDRVGLLAISSIILQDQAREDAIRASARNSSIKALVVRINSPGGTVVGGESLFTALRAFAAEKPVVAVMEDLATSAGYMAALGGDYIIARQSTITGSIGVILQTTEFTGLLEKLGITAEAIKSRPLKGQPSPLEKLSEEARAATQSVVSDIFDMFVDMVSARRGMSREEVLALADGRVFTGRQAVANGLVDALGSEKEAREWLAASHDIDTGLPLMAVKIRREGGLFRDILDNAFGKALFSERLRLDGLISLWQPNLR